MGQGAPKYSCDGHAVQGLDPPPRADSRLGVVILDHSTWFIDVQRLTRELSIASGPDKNKWNWTEMRGMLERVFSDRSPDAKHYLALIRAPGTDAEATRRKLEHFPDD